MLYVKIVFTFRRMRFVVFGGLPEEAGRLKFSKQTVKYCSILIIVFKTAISSVKILIVHYNNNIN